MEVVMRQEAPQDTPRSNMDIAMIFLLFAVALYGVGLFFLPVLIYGAAPLFFIAALFLLTKRRRRQKQHQEHEYISVEDVF